jgi:hypothetical protein
LSSGFTDIFIISCLKSDATLYWVKYIGTSDYDYAGPMAVNLAGSLFLTGTISSSTYTNGANDILIGGLTIAGKEIFVENMGGDLNDYPGGIIYNSAQSRTQVFGNS